MKKLMAIFFILAVMLLSISAIHAEDVNETVDNIDVEDSSVKTFSDLNYKINNTVENNVLNLNESYRFNSTSDESLVAGVEISKNISIVGKNNTYIDGRNIARGLKITPNCNVVLENLTFKNAFTANHGGAIYLGDNSTLIVKNCVFFNNSVYNSNGGSIFCRPGTNVDIIDSIFENNTCIRDSELEWVEFKSGMGSAISMTVNSNLRLINSIFRGNNAYLSTILVVSFSNGPSRLSTLYVKDCLFENNTARGNPVIYSDEFGKAEIIDSTFKNNKATGEGGILTLDTSVDSIVKNCLFEGNSAFKGGAIYIPIYSSQYISNVTITDCNFTNNSAVTAGGAIYSRYGAVNLSGCNFINNSCEGNGGQFYSIYSSVNLADSYFNDGFASYGGAIYSRYSLLNVSDCIFNNNSANMSGGAVYSLEQSFNLTGCNFTYNSAVTGGAVCSKNTTLVTYDCVFDSNLCEGNGGGLYSLYGVLDLSNSSFNKNFASYGGALYLRMENGTACVNNVKFTKNNASGSGGAVCSKNTTLVTYDCVFDSNLCEGNGGGLYSLYGVLDLSNSSFNKNFASYGGALYLKSENSTVNHVKFTSNVASATAGAVFSKIENVSSTGCTFKNNKDPKGREYYVVFMGQMNQNTVYYSNVGLTINLVSLWNVPLSQSIKLTFNGTDVYSTGWLKTDSKGKLKLTVPIDLPVGNYSASLSVQSGLYISSPVNVIVEKASCKITATKFTTNYQSDKFFNIRVMDINTKKYVSGVKVSLMVYTGKTFKTYKLTCDKNGLAKFDTSKLSVGKHNVEVTLLNNNVVCGLVKSSITINKAYATIVTPKTVKKYSKLKITVKNKLSKKVIKNTKFTLKIYTGKKYKTVSVKSDSKGIIKVTISKTSKGSHKMYLVLKNKNYNINNKFTVKVK